MSEEFKGDNYHRPFNKYEGGLETWSMWSDDSLTQDVTEIELPHIITSQQVAIIRKISEKKLFILERDPGSSIVWDLMGLAEKLLKDYPDEFCRGKLLFHIISGSTPMMDKIDGFDIYDEIHPKSGGVGVIEYEAMQLLDR